MQNFKNLQLNTKKLPFLWHTEFKLDMPFAPEKAKFEPKKAKVAPKNAKFAPKNPKFASKKQNMHKKRNLPQKFKPKKLNLRQKR